MSEREREREREKEREREREREREERERERERKRDGTVFGPANAEVLLKLGSLGCVTTIHISKDHNHSDYITIIHTSTGQSKAYSPIIKYNQLEV